VASRASPSLVWASARDDGYTYGLTERQAEWWRNHDTSLLARLREFAPYDRAGGFYHENWFTTREMELLLFHAGFAPLEHRAKYVFDYKERPLLSRLCERFPRLGLYVSAFEVSAIKV
jgi:hypothetical protein